MTEIRYEVPEVEPNAYDIDGTDTVMINGYLLYFQLSEKTTFADYYPEQAARDSIDTAYGNSHDYAMAIEDYLRPKYQTIFSVGDSTLIIKLANGKHITFRRTGGDVEDEWYNFDHYFSEIDYVLLHVQYYEGDAYTLVNRKNGFTKLIYGKPYFSPDKKSFITTSLDLDAAYNFNGIEYYLFQGDTVVKQFELGMSRCGPVQAKWTSDSTIAIEKECYIAQGDNVAGGYETTYGLMTIKR